jgi:hypothetical protein
LVSFRPITLRVFCCGRKANSGLVDRLMPGRPGFIILMTKPEFWLQLVMFIMFSELVRPQILIICVALNLWGIFAYVRYTRERLFQLFTYLMLREHCVDAIGEGGVAKFDKLVGYAQSNKPESTQD